MPLTKEQFSELRRKGLSVDQIVSFEQGNKPTQTVEKPGFFKSLIQDPIKTLLVKPAVRTGQAFGYGIGKLAGIPEENLQRTINKDVNVPILGGINIEAQKALGEGGGRQIVGDAAKSASYLYGTGGKAFGYSMGGVPGAVRTGLKGEVLQGAKEFMKTGAVGGGLYSFGDAIQDAENQPSDIAWKTLFGTVAGGATGLVLGAATPIVVKGLGAVNKYRNVGQLNEELIRLNNTTLKPTAKQSEKWGQQNVNPIKTYTEILSSPKSRPACLASSLVAAISALILAFAWSL